MSRAWKALSIIFLVWAIVASSLAAYYYMQYKAYESLVAGKVKVVNIGINFGNGTVVWYNNTVVPVSATAFDALRAVADVNYTVSPGFGVFITCIDGVCGNSSCGWVYFVVKDGKPELPSIAADKYVVPDGATVYFKYYNWVKEGWPPKYP